jgi:hypothetical protein
MEVFAETVLTPGIVAVIDMVSDIIVRFDWFFHRAPEHVEMLIR